MLGFRKPVPRTIRNSPRKKVGEAVKGQADVAEGDDDPAQQHAPPLAEEAVGDPAAGQRGQVDQRRVEAVNRAGLGRVPPQPPFGHRGGHEQEQDGPPAVVTEALPQFGEEEGRQSARVTEEETGYRGPFPAGGETTSRSRGLGHGTT